MNTPELTPHEALDFTEDALANNALSAIPFEMAPFLANFLIIMTEIVNDDCKCRHCSNIREVTRNI